MREWADQHLLPYCAEAGGKKEGRGRRREGRHWQDGDVNATPLPPLDELLECARAVAIPTRTRFRGVSVREAVVFDAPNGASEFSPFVEYEDREAASWLAAAIEYGWGEPPALRRSMLDYAEQIAGLYAG